MSKIMLTFALKLNEYEPLLLSSKSTAPTQLGVQVGLIPTSSDHQGYFQIFMKVEHFSEIDITQLVKRFGSLHHR